MPRLQVRPNSSGREVLAVWKPEFKAIDPEYVTDANGLELITRKVFIKNSAAVSSSFFPVTSVISMGNQNKTTALTVYNDRSQAGSVHYDGSLKILIDRRVKTNDQGGIPEKMHL